MTVATRKKAAPLKKRYKGSLLDRVAKSYDYRDDLNMLLVMAGVDPIESSGKIRPRQYLDVVRVLVGKDPIPYAGSGRKDNVGDDE